MDQIRLNPDDWPAAIARFDGRQVVVAGPGTGKTEFLVRRVGAIIDAQAAQASEIVVLSFSRRATGRLKERIEEVTGTTGVPVDVTTFHSLALRIIEASGGQRPIPLTTPEQVSLVRSLLKTEDPNDWPVLYRGVLDSHVFSSEVADFLLRCSERLLDPHGLEVLATERADWKGLPHLYRRYLDELSSIGRIDYGVLLTRAVDILGSPAHSSVVSRFKYVLVDEYQDTTPAQARMAELLAGEHNNLTVAGDPYQSIFSFRGAELRNIAAFSDTAGTQRIVLGQSFRVPGPIMDSALRVISGGDLPGSAGPVKPSPRDGACETYVFDQDTAEAEWIAREVEHLIRLGGTEPENIAVLVRSKRELITELSRALQRRSIPHDPPSSRLVDHPAVRVVQDLVTIAMGEAEVDPSPTTRAAVDRAMRHILLGPMVGLNVGVERQMARQRRRGDLAWTEVVADNLASHPGLIELISQTSWAGELGASEGFWTFWTTLDGVAPLVSDPGRDEWRRAWTAFAQMLGRQAERDPSITLSDFFGMIEEDDFEATPLISPRTSENRVRLTTLHQAKGLEFDVVFIANAVEGVFPDLRRSRRMLRPELLSPERTVDTGAQHLFAVQEEMRLAYTAMTRARRRVVWTATAAGIDQGDLRPSRFLMAAAGSETPGPPQVDEREPVTIREAETWLRRALHNPTLPPARRLAAARVLGDPPEPWWNAATFAGAVPPGPDAPVLGDQFRLSPSQADSYDRCPRKYVLERRLRLGDPTSVYAQLGQLTHEALEIAEGEIIGQDKAHADLERALVILDEVWEKADFGNPVLNRAWKVQAVEMLTNLYERWPGKGRPEAAELDVEMEIDGVKWIGRIDRIERSHEGLRVVDYKSGKTSPTKSEAAVSIQLGFYALAVAATGEHVVASEMWFPRKKSVNVSTSKLDMHRLPEVKEKMAEITHAIGEENWTPKLGAPCKRCGFRKSCPAWPEGKGAFLP